MAKKNQNIELKDGGEYYFTCLFHGAGTMKGRYDSRNRVLWFHDNKACFDIDECSDIIEI